MPGKPYRCPQCGSLDVWVECVVTLRLDQSNDGHGYPVLDDIEQINCLSYDDNSLMLCNQCEHMEAASEFKVSNQAAT